MDTPIPTPAGFVALGDIRDGDTVFDEAGAPCTVVKAHDSYVPAECYTVVFDDGTKVVADADHLWLTTTAAERNSSARRTPREQLIRRRWLEPAPLQGVRATREIACSVKLWQGRNRDKVRYNHAVENGGVVSWPEKTLPVNPYTFGVWLGDGSKKRASITCADHAILAQVQADGYKVAPGREGNAGRALVYTIGVTGCQGGQPNPFLDGLRAAGSFGTKAIPPDYLFASPRQRLDLLQGLMDTDGWCEKDGECGFGNGRPWITDAVDHLAKSLGVKTRRCEKMTDSGEWSYQVNFYTRTPVFRLSRKLERQALWKRRPGGRSMCDRRFITAVVPATPVPVRCLTVDSPSRLYLCSESFVPTHNTSLGPWWLAREIKRRGAGDYVAVTSTFPLFAKKMLPSLLDVFEQQLKAGRYWAKDKVIELRDPATDRFWARRGTDRMWGRILLGSAVSGGGLEAATAKAAWLDEAGQDEFRLYVWEAVLRRLALNHGRALLSSTIYNFGWLYCVTGDTLLTCPDGSRVPIESVNPGETVVTLGPCGLLKNSKVLRLVPQGIKPVWKVKTSSGRTISATETHPFLTREGWVKLGGLRIGDRIAVPRKLPCGTKIEPRARLLGWLTAEGSTSGSSLKISLGEQEAVDDVKNCLPEGVWLTHYAAYDYGIRSAGKNRFCPNPVTEWIRNLGLWGRIAHTKRVPEEAFAWDESSICQFLGGYFSGDGSVGKDRVYAATVSLGLAEDIQQLLLRIGVLSQIITVNGNAETGRNTIYHVRVCHARSMEVFGNKVRLIPRKQKEMIRWAMRTVNARTRIGANDMVPVDGGQWKNRWNAGVDDDIYWDKVVSLEELPHLPTYDIEVEGTHNFVGNAVFAHNTEVYQRFRDGDPDYDVIHFDSTENPAFPRAEWERARRTMPRWRFDMFYRGRFTKPAGVIYDCYEDEPFPAGHLHAGADFPPPAAWPRYLGLDFGGANTAGTFWAHPPGTNRVIGYREYLAGRRTASQHVEHLLKGEPVGRDGRVRIPTCFGGARSEGQWRDEFTAAGLKVWRPVVHDVEVGIARVYGAVATGRVLLHPSLEMTRREFRSYARKVGPDGQPTAEIEHKHRYHLLDGTRYVLAWLFPDTEPAGFGVVKVPAPRWGELPSGSPH